MTDEELFVRSSGPEETFECALVWRGLPSNYQSSIPLARYSWSEAGRAFLDRIRRLGKESGKPEGNELPYADFRAALQARVGGLILLQNRITSSKSGDPLFAANGLSKDVKAAANRSVAAWCQLTLRPWSERLGCDCGDVEALEKRAIAGELFEETSATDIPQEGAVPDALRSDFHQYADAILAIVTASLDGAELFPGLGPVHRIIDREYGNSISFETWPSAFTRGDDLFSMVAELSVETRPSSRLPFLVIRASKRIWCREFPAPNQLYGRRRISVRAVLRDKATHAVTLSVNLAKGAPSAHLDALVFEAARSSGESLTGDLTELVKNRGNGQDFFVGVPFRYGYRPVPKIEFGVTLQDQVDLTKTVAEQLYPLGFTDSRIRILDPATDRPSEFHQQANLHNLITHHFGNVTEVDLPKRVEELFGQPEKKSRGPDKPVKTIDLEPLVEANRERLNKAFGANASIDLMFVCRRESEEKVFRSVAELLFGGRVNVVRHALPEGVHGTKKALDGDARWTRAQRAALRKTAWTGLAEQIKDEYPRSPVIVQAAREYDGFEDDSVNKDVGRNTLATVAGCSVQYLLPPGSGKAAEYMHRVQAALYDLLFAHSGLGPVPANLIRSTFPQESSPRSIVGISVVSQASSRGGRPDGAELAIAMKVDVETGQILGRIGKIKGSGFDSGSFETLSRTLVNVAVSGSTSLGVKLPDRRQNFLKFVRAVVGDVLADDPNALIILESTHSRGLWPWLSDENISSEIFLEDRTVRPPLSWKTLRFVRVREKSAGRVGVLKQRHWLPVTRLGDERAGQTYDEKYATAIERLVESLPEGNARARHYLSVHGFGIRNRGARGQSVYRQKDGFQKIGAKTPKRRSKAGKVLSRRGANLPWDKPSRIPTTLEITVLPSQLGDNEDSIATLIAALRNGYSHTADGTFLPAPLSFKSKIIDYMDRYGAGSDTEGADYQVDEDIVDSVDDIEALASSGDEAMGYGELRRWFEGPSEFEAEDIPDFEGEDGEIANGPGAPSLVEIVKAESRSRAEIGHAIPSQNSSGAGIQSMATETVAIQTSGTPAMAVRTRLQVRGDDELSLTDESTQIDNLLRTVRGPLARLPGFVTHEFLASCLHLVNGDIRRMHEDRAWIKAVTGFPWPEDRPGIEQMPDLYLEALRYPAFAIVVQHQFFPEDISRGLPRNQLRRQFIDASKRAGKEKALTKEEHHLSVLRALHARRHGADLNLVLTELLCLPGQAAWLAKCADAQDGLARLDEAGEEFAEAATYLRDVVAPFETFGAERTIGDVFERLIIPQTLKRFLSDDPDVIPSNEVPDDVVSAGSTIPNMSVVSSAMEQLDPLEHGTVVSLATIEQQWAAHWSEISNLSITANAEGPDDGPLRRLREILPELEALYGKAILSKPKKISTAPIREALRATIADASTGLNELIGESLNAPEILARLFDVAAEAESQDLQKARDFQSEAQAAVSEASELASEVARLESTLPVRQAREQTGALIDSREKALRRALHLAEAGLSALPVSETGAVSPIVAEVPPIERKGVDGVSHSVSIAAMPDEDLLVEDIADLPVGDGAEPYDENPSFAPAIAVVQDVAAADKIDDPLRADVVCRLDKLFSLGEHGLAFHLHSAASTAMPASEFFYSAAEFRLAAAAGRTIGLSGQDLLALSEQRGQALSIAQSLAEKDDDRSLARRNLLLVGAIPAALFRSEDVAAVSLVESLGGKGSFAHYFKLVSVVEENRKRGFPLTPANVLAIEAHSREDSFVKDAVAAIKETIDGFKSSRFRFQLGEKLKHALTQPSGLLGRLGAELLETNQEIAREVSDELNGRDKALRYIDRMSAAIASGQEVDGAARERILSVLSQIGQQCSDLVQSIDGFNALRRSSSRLDTIRRLRDLALAGIEDVLAQADVADSLLGASTVQAVVILQSLRSVLQGAGTAERETAPLAVGLHSPLLWLPRLTWTGGWTPSPYDPDRILQEIMSASVPLLGSDPISRIEEAFEARHAESAFVPAYMLLNIAHWFGMKSHRIDAMRAKLDADKEVKKNQVGNLLRNADRLIDRMRRMAIGSLDQSARLKETLSAINPANLPVELSPTFLPEALTGDRVEDFNSALTRIHDVEVEAKREFDRATADYSNQIEELDRSGKLDEQTGGELRNLLGRHEFTTLADWLNMLRTGGVRKPLLPSGNINNRLSNFKSMLPAMNSVEPLQVARAVSSGSSMGPLDYSHLDDDRREEGAAILYRFPELKRLIKDQKGGNASQIKLKVVEVTSQLLYDVSDCSEDPILTRVRQQIYVFDAKVNLPPTDSTSLVLPEFGTLTQGSWRLCVVTPTISQQALVDLADGAGLRGVIVFYLGVLSSEKREQLRIDLSKRKRPMLVVDEALVAATIADRDDRRRAVIEIAQGYSSADPYKDHGKSAVPAEMFKGRSWERGEITEPFGSYVVYGGRRLGKTALLQQIHATQPPNAVFGYVDLDMVNDATDAFEQMSRKLDTEVFKSGVRTSEEFTSGITKWLASDERRRILLLIDEADKFVRNEAETGFRCIQTMLQLMAETKNRFKFVLAGLHNVSRIVRAENSPLVQISNNPLQIGPLLNRDVDDAEFLIRGPLAAMGYEFDSREDVWRILSFTNYYPVLIQVFCQELLKLIHEQVQRTGRLPASISTQLVERALSSSDVRSKLFQSFEKTIASIENRYELITYILAARELVERDSGMDAEGMTAAEVADRAMVCWPAAFQRGSDPAELEYLLEEMEGFGIARRTLSGNFALRSRSLLELMAASEADLNRKLESYKNLQAPPKPFDPKNFRRSLGRPIHGLDSDGKTSPLTDGQEADLLAPLHTAIGKTGETSVNPAASGGIGVVFGTEYAGIRYVDAALLDARRTKDKLVNVELKTFTSKKEMLDEAKRVPKAQRPRVVVISSNSPWRPDWVVEAERVGRVRKGDVRLVFVGGAEHAGAWARESTILKRVLPQIKIVKLRSWTRSYLGTRIESLQLPGDLVDRILQSTGGWSETAGPLMARITQKPAEASLLVGAEADRLTSSPDVLGKLGIPKDLVGFFRELAAYADGSTITTADFQFLCTSDGRNVSPRVVGVYSDLLGIISFPPDQTSGQGHRKVDLNPLAHAALLRRE